MGKFIHLRSKKFPILPGEAEELVNEGMYGKALAQYLETQLKIRGYDIPFFCCEDWGWWVSIAGAPFNFGVCIYCDARPNQLLDLSCTDGADSAKKWSWKKFRFIDTTPWSEKLHADLVTIFRADPDVEVISTDLDGPFFPQEQHSESNPVVGNIIGQARAARELPETIRLLLTAKLRTHSSGESIDENEELRFQVARELCRTLRPTDRHFVRYLLVEEITSHEKSWAVSDSIVLCAGMLFLLGNPEDAMLIWQAKRTTFDSDNAISIGFLAGAGLDRTIDYWRGQTSPQANELADFLTSAAKSGEIEDTDEARAEVRNYVQKLMAD